MDRYSKERAPLQRPALDAREALGSLRVGTTLLWGLPRFLRRPVDDHEADRSLARRHARRSERFLDGLERAVWSRPRSPYRALLDHAGCRPGDVSELVRRDGVEGALETLQRQGVYVTLDELKGLTPIRRGSLELTVTPEAFRHPAARGMLSIRSGGSTGVASQVGFDLRYLREIAVDCRLARRPRGGVCSDRALWLVPGAGELCVLLGYEAAGHAVTRRFSQVDVGSPWLHSRYRWSERLNRLGYTFAGRSLPRVAFAPVDDPSPVLAWLGRSLADGGRPALCTFPSSAVRLVEAAERSGLELSGVRLEIGGEPCTATRMARLRSAGLAPRPNYGAAETAAMFAEACLQPTADDEVHLFRDLFAIVQPALSVPELPPTALLLTSLARFPPLVLLNSSLGDRARLTRRRCGCPLADYGWTDLLHDIRSYRRVTVGGMAVLDAALETLLEDTLPKRFGGAVGDFQLLEEEREGGRLRLRLRVHPGLGPLPEDELVEAVLGILRDGAGAEAIAAEAWRHGGGLVVERRVPRLTTGGKLHVLRRADTSDLS